MCSWTAEFSPTWKHLPRLNDQARVTVNAMVKKRLNHGYVTGQVIRLSLWQRRLGKFHQGHTPQLLVRLETAARARAAPRALQRSEER
jgi:hypothetical protein